jgi:hypothetical protein
MVSTQHDFLFVHIPKTAGNAIQNVLRNYSEAVIESDAEGLDGRDRFGVTDVKYGTTKHSPLSEYHTAIEPEVYERLFKFAVVRNPWDRMISAYFSPHRGDVEWDPGAFAKFVRSEPPLRHYVDRMGVRGRIARKVARVFPVVARAIKPLDADLDFVIRFEQLSEDFERACCKIGISPEPLPVRNQSKRHHYSTYYTPALRHLVRERFAEEILFGNYSFRETE